MSKVIDNIEDIDSIDAKANLASPTFTGTVTATTFSGTLSGNASTASSASSCSGNSATATSATTATTATNLAGGSLGTIPYQSASGTTAQLAAGTSGYYLKSNGAAAPSWVEPPSGGITLAQAQAYDIGVNQTWQNVAASRAIGSVYTNTTGKPIAVYVCFSTSTASVNTYSYVNDVLLSMHGSYSNGYNTFYVSALVIVPDGSTYKFAATNHVKQYWYELR